MERIFQQKRLYIFFIGCLILFGLYQLDKNSRVDDNAIGENLYFLLKDGVVRSEMMRGYGGLSLEVQQTIFHKLFIYLAYPFVALTGWSLFSLHLFALLCFAGLLLALWKGFRFLVPFFRKKDRLLYGCLFLINYNVLYFSGTFRPEALLTLLGFWQFVCLQKYLEKASVRWLLMAALLGGSCLATHPHGLIFLAAGVLLLFTQKRWRALPVYILVSAVVFGVIYGADIISEKSFNLFRYQASHDPLIALEKKAWYSPFVSLSDEYVRLFFNEREIVASLLVFFSLILAAKTIRRQATPLLIYFFGSLAALGLISYSNSPQYLFLYLPYMLAIVVMAHQRVESGVSRAQKFFWHLLLAAYIVVHLTFAFMHIFRNFRDLRLPGPAARNAAVARLLPQPHNQKSILAYDDFIFNEIKNFRRIQSLTIYSFFREARNLPPISLSGVLDAAQRSEIDFILLNPSYRERFGATDSVLRPYTDKPTPPNLYYHSPEYTIFRIR